MKWESLISTRNLKLAWRRINTGTNLQYKRFFREAYLVYESAADKHLKQLHNDLAAKSWQPSFATRLYMPKPSGLQRPLSLLGIEDQILLQAIANLFAKKLYDKRRHVELNTVFSNILSDSKNSIFFVEHWRTAYDIFQKKCRKVFYDGYKWSAHFDLAAFYDTISHDLLLSIESSKTDSSEVGDVVKKWLQRWSAESSRTVTGHGIPQGPIASNFLAEAFFLPIDTHLQKRPFKYLRYVDDIRLFGQTENEVREAAILLEQECRERGLIPQSTKFDICKLKSATDAIGMLPSIPPTDNKDAAESLMEVVEARNILQSAIYGKPQKIKDKARFRYVMYRAPGDTELLKTVLRLLPRHPEHIDAFTAYFANFGKRNAIVSAILRYLKTSVPYSYVRGELWHVIARLAKPDDLQDFLPIAREDAKQRTSCIALSWGVMHFLMRCEKEGLIHNRQRLKREHQISRSLLAPIIGDRELSAKGQAGQAFVLLTGNMMEQLAGARELQKRKLKLEEIGLRQKDLSTFCKTVLLSLGVIPRRYGSTNKDYVNDKLVKHYRCLHLPIWRRLLGSEYEHALQILIEIEVRFLGGSSSEWLALQDSFNDLVVRQFFIYLKEKGFDGYSNAQNKKGNLVNYGSLIKANTPFDIHYPSEAKAFRKIHDRRNKVPGSHPYDQKGGVQNKWLNKKERDSLIPLLRNALDGIAKVVKKNS